MNRTPHSVRPIVLVAAALAAGCGSDATHPITQKREIAAPRPEQNVAADTLQRLSPRPPQGDPHAGHDHGPAEFAWDLPPGWKELPPARFRDGNFAVPGRDRLECYVTILPGGGGDLAANVNRWRQQMGKPQVSAADVAALPRVTILGSEAPFVLIDGTFAAAPGGGEGYSMAATMASAEGAGVTVKLVGPTEDVVAELANFKALCASLRATDPHAADAAPPAPDRPATQPAPAGGFDPASIRWTLPEGWKEAAARPMRLVTAVPEGVEGVECYVTILRGGGSLADNVNRWRGQVGLAAQSPAEIADLEKVEVLGKQATSMVAEGAKDAVYGVICEMGAHSVFVKMTGPAEALRAQRERFLAFCRSLRS